MNPFDNRKIDALLTMASLGAFTEHKEAASPADATDQTRREREALRRPRRALARAARTPRFDELAASIFQEVIEPLAAIRLNGATGLRWLDDDSPNPARARILMERIINDAGRVLDMVDLIRAIAAGHGAERIPLTLDEIITDVIASLQNELRLNNVAVTVDLTPPPTGISGNRHQLRRLVGNLVINAVQALETTGRESRKIAIRTSEPANDRICCIVEDSGPGIGPSHFPHLFEEAFTTRTSGVGIGLILSRSIVEAHGGEIRADNNSSLGGARVTFTLPAIGDSDMAR